MGRTQNHFEYPQTTSSGITIRAALSAAVPVRVARVVHAAPAELVRNSSVARSQSKRALPPRARWQPAARAQRHHHARNRGGAFRKSRGEIQGAVRSWKAKSRTPPMSVHTTSALHFTIASMTGLFHPACHCASTNRSARAYTASPTGECLCRDTSPVPPAGCGRGAQLAPG